MTNGSKKPVSFLVGAAMLVPGAAAASTSVLIEGVPHVQQKPDFCGEACVESVLRHAGSDWTQDDVFEAGGVDPALGRGLWTKEMKVALERMGFSPGRVWYSARSPKDVRRQWRAVLSDLHDGVPSILCTHYDDSPNTTEHFRLILGYDAKTDEVVYHEPAVANGAYRRMKLDHLIKLWPLKYDPDRWTVIRLRLDRKRQASYVPSTDVHRPADFAQHVMALKARDDFPDGFTIEIEPPFVVLGDESPSMVERRATGTVRWAVDKLEQDFFDRPPKKILDVWLFKNRRSYEKHNRLLFGEVPDTPYGFYSPSHGALIMNIATGGGTLVHEIVHPYMEANVPNVPAWLNEGLGSLYEQSGQKNGHIIGYTNWRLHGLQETIASGHIPSFANIAAMSDAQFYADDTGTNYAASRYLLYYLQEHGKLVPFFRAYLANRRRDPTGYRTLVRTLGVRDMAKFERKWARYVMRLRFPA